MGCHNSKPSAASPTPKENGFKELNDSNEITMVEESNACPACVVGGGHTIADHYFDSYGHFGTGLLSFFCAKIGAKRVYAVECFMMTDTATEIVKAIGYNNLIIVLKGKVEEIELPTKVDVIISEWVPGGVTLLDRTSLFITAIEDTDYKQDKIVFWNNVYGFDMSCIKKQAMLEPLLDTLDQNQTMDIEKMASNDVSISSSFKLVATRDDFIHAFVAYFDDQNLMQHIGSRQLVS